MLRENEIIRNNILRILREAGAINSNGEGRRLLTGYGVKIEEDMSTGKVQLRVGKNKVIPTTKEEIYREEKSTPTDNTRKIVEGMWNGIIDNVHSSMKSRFKEARDEALSKTKISDVTKKDYKVSPDVVMELTDKVNILEKKVSEIVEEISTMKHGSSRKR